MYQSYSIPHQSCFTMVAPPIATEIVPVAWAMPRRGAPHRAPRRVRGAPHKAARARECRLAAGPVAVDRHSLPSGNDPHSYGKWQL